MTQVLFDLSYLESFLERVGGSRRSRCSSASGRSGHCELAVRVHNETPGDRRPRARPAALPGCRGGRGRGRSRRSSASSSPARDRSRPASTSSRRSVGRSACSTCSRRSNCRRRPSTRASWRVQAPHAPAHPERRSRPSRRSGPRTRSPRRHPRRRRRGRPSCRAGSRPESAVTSRSDPLTSTSAVLPTRPARASNGPFSGNPRIATEAPRVRAGDPQRGRRQAGHAEDGDILLAIDDEHGGRVPAGADAVCAGDDVGGSDDDVRAPPPSRSPRRRARRRRP